MLSEANIIKMIDIVIDKIFVLHDGRAFQQTAGIPIGMHCIPDLPRYPYETSFIQLLLNKDKREEASPIL